MWNQNQNNQKQENSQEKKVNLDKLKKDIQFSQKKEQENSQEKSERISSLEKKENIYDKILRSVKKQVEEDTSPQEIKKDAEEIADEKSAEDQVKMLVKLAQHRGVVHAVKVAQHMENYYILDRLHDEMSLGERMYQSLEKENLIKE